MTQPSAIAVSDTAVRIAAEVIGEESIARIGRDLGTIHRDEIVRQGLEAVYRLLVQTETHRVHGEICAAVQSALWHVPPGPEKDKIRAAFARAFPNDPDTHPCINAVKPRIEKIMHPSGDDGGEGLAWVPGGEETNSGS